MRDWRIAMLMIVVITMLLPLDATAKAECDTSLPALYQQVSPSVVFISAVSVASMHPGDRIGTVVGSGVLIEREGLILTNSHVIFGHRAISVTLDNGYTTSAKLLGADPILDVAVLRIPVPDAGLPKATLGDSDALQVGEEVGAPGSVSVAKSSVKRCRTSSSYRSWMVFWWRPSSPAVLRPRPGYTKASC